MSATSQQQTTLAPKAYCKAIMHAVKHATQPVAGILLGKRVSSGASDDSDCPCCFVADAVPILHSQALAPSPILDVAVLQVSSVCHTKGMSVVGIYVANEREDDSSITDLTKLAVKGILERVKPSAGLPFLLLQLQNHLVRKDAQSVAAKCYLCDCGTTNPSRIVREERTVELSFARWNADVCNTEAVATAEVLAQLRTALEAFMHAKLRDFEEHLEDVNVDYYNEAISKQLDA